ncbi:hypothetical protein B484DRAFT_408180 [Ochromonadaceae sp. CCMP2298]|nr:hypothetical protein B484DRAFT_408180 [Ochromonadaceae sp. CCMP2298]
MRVLTHPTANIVLSPHVAGVTQVSYTAMGDVVAANILRVFAGLPPEGAVNKPE